MIKSDCMEVKVGNDSNSNTEIGANDDGGTNDDGKDGDDSDGESNQVIMMLIVKDKNKIKMMMMVDV